MFWFMWKFSQIALPRLDNIRFAGGRHPLDVLVLMDDIKNAWAPVAVGMAIYILSFVIRQLNTASAVATTALVCCAMLVTELLSALSVIGFW
jgi:hypothetical protein